jgi:Tfp pilus assembly protein PilX
MKRSRLHRARRGTVLVATLVCLVITTALVGSMLQAALRARRQLQIDCDVRQAELLVASGLRRAAYRLAAETGYRGETWVPAMPVLADDQPPRVTIEIAHGDRSGVLQIKVIAELFHMKERVLRRTQTAFVPIHSTTVQESSS